MSLLEHIFIGIKNLVFEFGVGVNIFMLINDPFP